MPLLSTATQNVVDGHEMEVGEPPVRDLVQVSPVVVVGDATSIDKVMLVVSKGRESERVRTTELEPVVVGVPVMIPLEDILSPAGSPLLDQVRFPNPPVSLSV